MTNDKAMHAIGGAVLYFIGAFAADLLRIDRPALVGLLAASAGGVAKEAIDYVLNARAMRSGRAAQHDVSWLDCLATTAGGAAMWAAASMGGAG
jgi:hypothetical protein